MSRALIYGLAAIWLCVSPAIAQRYKDMPIIRVAPSFPGTDACAKIQTAHDDLSPTGGVVDAQALEGPQACTKTLVLSKPTKLLLCSAVFTWASVPQGTTELLRIEKTSTIEGCAGTAGTAFVVGANIPATVDMIRTAPVGAGMIGLTLKSFTIRSQSGTPGRHAIHIDTTAFSNYLMLIDQVNISATLGGHGVYSTNPTLRDGFFISTIQNSFITNGIFLNRAGDTIRILNNFITGKNAGVDATFVSGATTLIVEGNNVTNLGGGIHLGAAAGAGEKAVSARIVNNEFESPQGFTGSNGAMIDIDGAANKAAVHTLIQGNSIQIIPSAPFNVEANGVRVNHASDTYIDGNYFGRGVGASKDIVITNKAVDTVIGINRYKDRIWANILSNAGTGTLIPAMQAAP